MPSKLRSYVETWTDEYGHNYERTWYSTPWRRVWDTCETMQILPRSACLEEAKETQGCVQKEDENPQVFFVVQCKILELIAQSQKG